MTGIPSFFIRYGGEFAALTTALFWVLSATAFSHLKGTVPALEINFIKSALGALLTGAIILVLGGFPRMDPAAAALFALSGAVGIGIGDSGYLAALNYLGVRTTMLLTTLSPPITALIALVFLGERLPATSWLGILLTVSGVAWVISENRGQLNGQERHDWRKGVALGLLCPITMAFSSVLSRAGFAHGEIDPFASSLVRLFGASFFLLPVLIVLRVHPSGWLRERRVLRTGGFLVLGTVLGPLVGASSSQLALKLIPAGVAQTLISTNPLFALLLAVLAGEKVTLRAILGGLVVVLGVALIFGVV